VADLALSRAKFAVQLGNASCLNTATEEIVEITAACGDGNDVLTT
jgi:hypothetical protein